MADVRNNPAENRYEISIDGTVVGASYYTLAGNSIVFTHTEVTPNLGERGLGTQLVQTELDDIRANTSLRVVAQCPFVAHFIQTNPAYEPLLTR